jgi:hypothetical protein
VNIVGTLSSDFPMQVSRSRSDTRPKRGSWIIHDPEAVDGTLGALWGAPARDFGGADDGTLGAFLFYILYVQVNPPVVEPARLWKSRTDFEGRKQTARRRGKRPSLPVPLRASAATIELKPSGVINMFGKRPQSPVETFVSSISSIRLYWNHDADSSDRTGHGPPN